VLVGCLPVIPGTLPFASAFTPPALHAATGTEASDRITELRGIAGTTRHPGLVADCLGMLGIFRLSRQVTTVNRVLRRLTDGFAACPDPTAAPAR
jgi:hypothetical protein